MKRLLLTYSLALLALIFNLTGCGHTLEIAPDFAPLVSDFSAHHEVSNLIVEYGETSNVSAGATCYQDTGTPRIAVNRNTWEAMSDSARWELLFHEMGHCVLGRTHTTERYPEDNCPVSIMNASPVGDWCRNAHGEDYKKELFNE